VALEADQAPRLAGHGCRVAEGSAGDGSLNLCHADILALGGRRLHVPAATPATGRLYAGSGYGATLRYQSPVSGDSPQVLRTPVPGRLFGWVKVASYVELGLFAGLLVVWLAPGLEHETFLFGLAHGIGFILLALLVWAAVIRHEAPYTLLAATLTPVGPVGSVLAIAWIERRQGPSAG
jgi:hypothetical protein